MENNNEQTIKEVLEELKNDTLETNLIQDNKLHFRFNDKIYRVVMPNQKQNTNAINFKNKQYIKLLQEDGTLTIKQLINLLKEKQDIDIIKMDEKTNKLEKELTQLHLSLYKKQDTEKKSIEDLKQSIREIRSKRLEIVLEKAGFLSPAIENQVQDDYYRYLTSMCTEILESKEEEKETWKSVWESFDEYEKDNSKLPYFALSKIASLMYGV